MQSCNIEEVISLAEVMHRFLPALGLRFYDGDYSYSIAICT